MAKAKTVKVIDPDSPKGRVEKLAGLLERYLNKNILITFGKHSSPAILESVKLATQNDIKFNGGIIPDMRKKEKDYTPSCVWLKFKDFNFFLVLEDIQDTRLKVNGIEIVMYWGSIVLEET